uniref:Uncharacterized protein n=1 Tax=Tetranychus urticae TaxID=32264 RepID=T1JUI7_TETUR
MSTLDCYQYLFKLITTKDRCGGIFKKFAPNFEKGTTKIDRTAFFRGVLEELQCFIKGETNSKIFMGLFDLGPIHGLQWRHWCAKYIDANKNYFGKEIEQLKKVKSQHC